MLLTALLLSLLSFVGLSYACSCSSLSWATCDESSCECYIIVGEGERQILKCNTSSIPKCLLMKAKMYHRYRPSSWSKPAEIEMDNGEGLYDPECDSSGLFKAKQCNNTDVCWCVDSSGVRRSENGDRNLTCEELAEAKWLRVEMKHKKISDPLEISQWQSVIARVIEEQYREDQQHSNIKVKYDAEASLITVDVKGELLLDPSSLAYHLEKDFLYSDEMEFESTHQKLELESILVFYKDEKVSSFSTQRFTTGILIVTAGFIVLVLVGLLILFLVRKKERSKYEKAQTCELEEKLLPKCQLA